MSFTTWTIPATVIRDTEIAFRKGAHEVFAFWTAALGPASGNYLILRCVVPRQTPGVTPDGVYVHIAGDELSRVQVDNFRRGERGVVQLHTHPGSDVTMSGLDRKWEVVKHVGALSIIVPHYCRWGLGGFPGVNVYEREPNDWRLWSANEAASRLKVL